MSLCPSYQNRKMPSPLLTPGERQHGCTLQPWITITLVVTILGIYYNSVLTTGCELGRHLYSPDFTDEEPEAPRGP